MVLICAGYRAGKVFMDNEMSLFLCNACGCRRDTAQTFKRLVSDPSKGYFNNTPQQGHPVVGSDRPETKARAAQCRANLSNQFVKGRRKGDVEKCTDFFIE